MKKLMLASFALVSVSSFGLVPVSAEHVLVKEITQRANLMPGPGPRPPVYTTIAAEVTSNGCTDADDFRVNVRSTRSGQMLSIIRVNPDPCDMVAVSKTIELQTTDALLSSHSPILLVNPLRVDERVVY